jgi:hypothetical protein
MSLGKRSDAAWAAFTEGAQHNRLMRLTFPKKDGPHAIKQSQTEIQFGRS